MIDNSTPLYKLSSTLIPGFNSSVSCALTWYFVRGRWGHLVCWSGGSGPLSHSWPEGTSVDKDDEMGRNWRQLEASQQLLVNQRARCSNSSLKHGHMEQGLTCWANFVKWEADSRIHWCKILEDIIIEYVLEARYWQSCFVCVCSVFVKKCYHNMLPLDWSLQRDWMFPSVSFKLFVNHNYQDRIFSHMIVHKLLVSWPLWHKMILGSASLRFLVPHRVFIADGCVDAKSMSDVFWKYSISLKQLQNPSLLICLLQLKIHLQMATKLISRLYTT